MCKVIIADKHAIKQKTTAIYFVVPNTEPGYVYLQQTSRDGSIEAPIEIDTDSILELAEAIKKRNKIKKVI